MGILVSELYGKQIITTGGERIGRVEDVILDFESGEVGSILLVKLENIARSDNTAQELKKNSVIFKRVKSISEAIVVGRELP